MMFVSVLSVSDLGLAREPGAKVLGGEIKFFCPKTSWACLKNGFVCLHLMLYRLPHASGLHRVDS